MPPTTPGTSSRTGLSSSSSSRIKATQETPRKSQIGAPTPLAARASGQRLANGAIASVPSTPISSTPSVHNLAASTSQSARHRSSYRTEATSGISYHHSTRTLGNGYSVSCTSRPRKKRRGLTSLCFVDCLDQVLDYSGFYPTGRIAPALHPLPFSSRFLRRAC